MVRYDIINPPYSFFDKSQQVNRSGGAGNGSKYDRFISHVVAESDEQVVGLIPDGWTMNSKHTQFRKFLIDNGLKSIHYFSRKIFPHAKLMGDVVVFFLKKGYVGPIEFVDGVGQRSIERQVIETLEMLPFTNHELLNTMRSTIGMDTIYKSGKQKTTAMKLSAKKYTKSLSREQTKHAHHKMISRLGGSVKKNEILWIPEETESALYHKVCFTKASAERKLTYLQYVPKGISVSEKVGYFIIDNKNQAINAINYLNSKYIATIVWHLKILSHNSKHMLSFIPLLNFDHPVDEDSIIQQFGPIDHSRPTYMLPSVSFSCDDTIQRQERRKCSAEVFTPDSVAAYMANLFEGEVDGVEFYDICCGDGQLLHACADRLIAHGCDTATAESHLYGLDIQEENISQCQVRMPFGHFIVVEDSLQI